jgi:hypothetical protein
MLTASRALHPFNHAKWRVHAANAITPDIHMRRRLFIKSGSAAVAVALSGCGGGGDVSAADPAAPAAAGAKVLTDVLLTAPAEPVAGTRATGPFNVGLNLHTGGTSPSQNTEIAAILQARNFKCARMDYYGDQSTTLARDMVSKINSFGGSVEMSMQIPYQWDNTIYAGARLATIETTAYDQTYAAVNAMKDLVHDYELLNEITHRPETSAQVPNNSGQLESAYTGKTAFLSIAAVCRGMANAIHAVGAASGLPLRVILGTTGRDWGFLRFMQTQGVNFDVVGWHHYPAKVNASLPSDPWFGAGGAMAQLAAFNKPVTCNEFNAAEIYHAGYENAKDHPLTEQGFASNAKHMLDLYSQTTCDLESVVFYELLDEPSKPAPENHFGLMSDLNTPKVSLYLATALAGGALSAAERTAITSRALLTDAQIDAMQRG